MWIMVLVKNDNTYVREEFSIKPDYDDLKYYEKCHSSYNSQGKEEEAICINLFEVEEQP